MVASKQDGSSSAGGGGGVEAGAGVGAGEEGQADGSAAAGSVVDWAGVAAAAEWRWPSGRRWRSCRCVGGVGWGDGEAVRTGWRARRLRLFGLTHLEPGGPRQLAGRVHPGSAGWMGWVWSWGLEFGGVSGGWFDRIDRLGWIDWVEIE